MLTLQFKVFSKFLDGLVLLFDLELEQWCSVFCDLVVGFINLLEILVSDSLVLLLETGDLSVFPSKHPKHRFKFATFHLFQQKLLSWFPTPELCISLALPDLFHLDNTFLISSDHLSLVNIDAWVEDTPLPTMHRCSNDLLSLPSKHPSTFKVCHWIATAFLAWLLDDVTEGSEHILQWRSLGTHGSMHQLILDGNICFGEQVINTNLRHDLWLAWLSDICHFKMLRLGIWSLLPEWHAKCQVIYVIFPVVHFWIWRPFSFMKHSCWLTIMSSPAVCSYVGCCYAFAANPTELNVQSIKV